jgi:predicted MFS family arabinose efflux permease
LINIIGPVIGAALLAIPGVNIGNVLWIDVVTFGIALIPLLFIKIPSNTTEVASKKRESFILQMTEGFKALNKTKGMIALIFAAMTINFFSSPFTGLLSLFVNKIHQGNEANYALVIGLFQAGIVIGGLAMSLFKGFKKPIMILMIYVIYQAVCQIVLVFIPTNFTGRFWTIGSIVFLLALPVAVLDVSFITTIQVLIPKDKIGRVMATIMAIAPAMRPLGQFLSGVIAEYTGIKIVFIVSAILSVISFVIIYFTTSIRKLDSKIHEAMTQTTEEDEKIEIDKPKEIKIVHEDFAIELPMKHPEPQFKSDIAEPVSEMLK